MLPGLLSLLLLLPALRVSANTVPEPCEVDDEDVRCFCNFTDPEPDWSSALQCISAVEVEIRGGGRSLEQFLKLANTDPKQYADAIKAVRTRRLTVGDARVPAQLLFGALRGLGYSRLRELTLENLEVSGAVPPLPVEAPGPALTALRLRNVSWTVRGAWLAELQQWLKPGLKVLSIVQTQPLVFSCDQLGIFQTLTALDLSDSSGLGEQALPAALCPLKFPALQSLALRNAGVDSLAGVCAALAAAGVQPQSLDLSHNALRPAAPGAPSCVWPRALSDLNLSSTGLEQVPKGLPAKLNRLDLSCNRLSRAPRSDELPEVSTLILDGNPYLDPEAHKHQDQKNSGVQACARSTLALGVSGAAVLLRGAVGFA